MTDLKDKIWKLFDVLRGERLEDYNIILLFIYLRSENIISEKLLKENDLKASILNKLVNGDNSILNRVYDVFITKINRLNQNSIERIIDILNSIDPGQLKKNISEIYDDTLESIMTSQGKMSGMFTQPNQLTNFINSYIGKTKGLRVYNPFAGVASFIKDYKDASSIHAQELNHEIWAIGQLRLMIHGSSARYECDNSVANWPQKQKFDLIVSNPPIGMQTGVRSYLSESDKEKYSNLKNCEEFILNKGF